MGEQNVDPNGRAIIVGAGVTGLTVGWQLAYAGMDVLLLEAMDHLGGMAGTFKHGDFLLDMGPHKFFSVMENRMQTARELMGEEFLIVPKRSRIRLSGHFLNYPIGLLDIMKNLDPLIAVTGGVSYLLQLMRNVFNRRPDISYEDWLIRRFGPKLYQLIFAEYARKIWGEPRTLARELAETRVAVPGLLPLLWHMLFARNKGRTIHAETFNYPRFGSGQFCDRLAELLVEYGGVIRCDASVTRLGMAAKSQRVGSIQLEAGEPISVHPEDVVVTTVPVSFLSRIIDPAPPTAVTEAASQLKTRPLVLLYLILNRPSVSKDNWLFFPEAKYIFNRVFEQKNFSPFMCPEDKTVLCLEIVASDMDLWRASETDLFERAITGLEETGLVHRSQVIEYFSRRLKWAYPVYDLDYRRNTETVLQYLDSMPNLYSVGRQGGFNYVGQIDCLDIGILTAEHILHHRQAQDAAVHWADVRQRFANYIVLD